jgi:hypothetical protein
MIMTDFVKFRIIITMFVKIDYEVGKLFEIAKFCGVAPCTIILCNGARNEAELPKQIWVPVSTPKLAEIVDLPVMKMVDKPNLV